MRATILPYVIILTKARRAATAAAVSKMAKECIVARVLPLKCFLFLLPYYIHVNAIMRQQIHIMTREKYCSMNIPST